MKNFIVRTITGVIFVAAVVASFLTPEGMVALFALVTGLTVWEFTGLVNDRPGVTVNRFICQHERFSIDFIAEAAQYTLSIIKGRMSQSTDCLCRIIEYIVFIMTYIVMI
jgi:hypothetical protein